MKHSIIDKEAGHYCIGPLPRILADGRLAVAFAKSPFADHYALADWIILASRDEGETWQPTDDPAIPFTWPGANTRERYDRFADIQPDGSYLAAGTVGFEVWPKERKAEAEALGYSVREHPNLKGKEIVIGIPRMFVQRSRDGGQPWQRQEWFVPGFNWLTAFPRWIRLAAGNILLPVYGLTPNGSQVFVWRSDAAGERWQLLPIGSSIAQVRSDEMGFFEVAPNRVLALIRNGNKGTPAEGYLLESWSEDGGVTWSQPLRTDIRGYPPHIIRLQDGRLLCAVTYRWEPMGIRAVLSRDNGQTWDTQHPIILRDDAGAPSTLWPKTHGPSGASDVGYPITVQFANGDLFTCYWTTEQDGITHIAATKWRADEF